MKPFNLEEAKAGKPVCTRDGRPARIVCFDIKGEEKYSILALVTNSDKEIYSSFTKDGKFFHNKDNHPTDLMMVDDEPKESEEILKYCAIFKSADGTKQYAGIKDTPEQCIDKSDNFIGVGEIRIKPIEEKQHFVGYIGLLPNRDYNSNYNINPNILKLCTNIYKSKETIPVATNIVKIEWEE